MPMRFSISCTNTLELRKRYVLRSQIKTLAHMCFDTIYPPRLCLVMESFCRFSPEIPDRLVQSASKLRDIVLCLLQALPEEESFAESVPSQFHGHRELANRAICDGKRTLRRSGREYLAGDNTLRSRLLCPAMGLMEGVNTMSCATSRIRQKNRAGARVLDIVRKGR